MADEVNVPLLRKAVEWVEAQAEIPEIDREWLQRSYVATPEHLANRLAYSTALEVWNALHPGESMYGSDYQIKPEYTEIYNRVIDQVAPHCGTAYCVAGYIGAMHNEAYVDSEVDVATGVHVSDFAQRQLGITHEQADELFAAMNSAEKVRAVAEKIAGEKL